MKRLMFLVLIAGLFLTGCVEYGITIKVNKDGSGEIVEKMLLTTQLMNMGKALNPDGDSSISYTEENQIEKAPNFGEGVVFKSLEKINTESKEGYKVVYNFSDINKVKLSEEMFDDTIGSLTDGMDMGMDDDEDEEDDEDDFELENFFKFDYNKRGKLVINNGFAENINRAKEELKEREDQDDDEEEMSDAELEQAFAMSKMLFQGMKFYMKVEFDSIKDANVAHENNQVTLFEIDLGKLMSDKEAFKELRGNSESEISKVLNKEKKIEGVTFHHLEKITVDFK